jgi:hypothetical protein
LLSPQLRPPYFVAVDNDAATEMEVFRTLNGKAIEKSRKDSTATTTTTTTHPVAYRGTATLNCAAFVLMLELRPLDFGLSVNWILKSTQRVPPLLERQQEQQKHQ